MDTTAPVVERPAGRVWLIIAGGALVAAAIFSPPPCFSRSRPPSPAPAASRSFAGRVAERPYSPALIAVDAAAFALFAILRNDGLGFWQLPGPWIDVLRFNLPSAGHFAPPLYGRGRSWL